MIRAGMLIAVFIGFLMWGLTDASAQCSTPTTTRGGVVLTLDDNSVDSWYGARAILNSFGVKATFFVSNFQNLTSAQVARLRVLQSDGHEIASHSYSHDRASNYSSADYIAQEILPHLSGMAAAGFYPRNFAYPFGTDVPATTEVLMAYYGFVRDTAYSLNAESIYVTCEEQQRFIAGLGIDYQYGRPLSDYDQAFDRAMCNDENVVLYGHWFSPPPNNSQYYVDHARLSAILQAAQNRGLSFRRVQDICRWSVAYSGTQAWMPAHDSPIRFGNVAFGDFDGDGDDDAFRTNGRKWQMLENQGGTFYDGGDEHWADINTSQVTLDKLAFGDFDGDGRTDVFYGSGRYWYVSFAGTGSWQRINASGYPTASLRFGDFDGNGTSDIFLSSGGRWYVSYAGTSAWTQVQSSGYPPDRLGLADFNGDGKTDVFVASGGTWYISSGATARWSYLNTSSFGRDQLHFADLNGDGRDDVLRTSGSHWYVSWGGSSAWSVLRAAAEQLPDLGFADLNGDGATDVLRVARP